MGLNGINDIKQSSAVVATCFDRLVRKVEAARTVCPQAKIIIDPVLPTKSYNLNFKAKQFNNLLVSYVNFLGDPNTVFLDFTHFCDSANGLLKTELGRFHNKADQLHLGSAGIRLLAKIIRERVLNSKVDGRPYS